MIETEISVDRITLVGHSVDYKLRKVLASSLLVDGRYRAQYPYDWRYELVGGGVMEIGSLKNQSDIRLDFNPNSVKTEEHKNMIQNLIGAMKYVKATRIDPALDVKGIDLNDYAVIDKLSRKTNIWRSGVGRLETYYIGAPKSDLRIRMYDKALEQGLKDVKWWRIESQLRREFAENYKKFNPFKDVTLIRKEVDLSSFKSFKEQVFIRYLLENPQDLGKLDRKTRAKYKKILKELAHSDSKDEIDFLGVFDSYKTIIDKTIKEYIQVSQVNNVI